jgi:capsular polysaccharide transport system permease protein
MATEVSEAGSLTTVDDVTRVQFIPAAGTQTDTTLGTQSVWERFTSWVRQHLVFTLTVVVPTVCAIIYFGLIASDVYTSESRFLIRSPQKPVQTGLLGDFLQSTGITHSQDDTYSVRDFILSRDALKELDGTLAIRRLYTRDAIDWFGRFPDFDRDRSFEAFFKYYRNHVGVDYDPVTSISVLSVRAFSAQDAYRINSLLLDMSERLINRLNERSRQDLIRFAQSEVKIAQDKARDASLAMLTYRSQQSVFEPNKQAAIQLEGVARLEGELVSTEAELAQLRKLSPDNPQIIGLESRAETLRTAITSEAAKVTSAKGSLSARAPDFERLALESTFADKQLGAALAELQAARSEAARQQLYLERLVQPSLPDHAMEPRRIRSVLTVLALGLIAWGVASLVLAAVREHAD